MDSYLLLNYVKNSYTFTKFFISLGRNIAVKSGLLGGTADIFMSIFSADTPGFALAM